MKINDKVIEINLINLAERLFGKQVINHAFIPVGEESYAYLITLANHKKYFIKYCQKQNYIETIDKVHTLLLNLKSFNFVVPPIEINDQTSFTLNGGRVSFFPFVEGKVFDQANEKLTQDLVDKLTQIIAQIHTVDPKTLNDLPKEKFENNYAEKLKKLLDQADKNLTQKASQLLHKNRKLINKVITEQNQAAQHYKQKEIKLVLTHGDITGLNIITTNEGQVKLVDWDDAMLTPPERDINFLFDNPHFSIDKYAQLSGITVFDPEMKEYYGRQWSLDSIIGNFESLINKSTSKTNEDEYLEEIEEYLSYYM